MTSRTTPTAGPGHETAEQPRGEPQRRTLRRMAVVVRDDGYDRLLTPLAFAYGQARRGVQVDLLFVLWAVRVLTTEGVATPRVTGQHADEAAWLRDRLRSGGEPVEIHDQIGRAS